MNLKIDGVDLGFSKISLDEQAKMFILSDDKHDEVITIDYEPTLDLAFKDTEMELYFFSNPYLNAENDHFQVFLELAGASPRIGWMMPLTVLASDDVNDKFLNRYKYKVFEKLLQTNQANLLSGSNPYGRALGIMDIFDPTLKIFAFSKSTLPAGDKFDILQLLPALANYGYYLWGDKKRVGYFNDQGTIIRDKFLGSPNKIRLKRSLIRISGDQFLETLYKIHLQSLEYSFIKFHFLYQVIEHFIEIHNRNVFVESYKKYGSGELLYNDWRELSKDFYNERRGIRALFDIILKDLDQKNIEIAFEDFLAKAKITKPKSNSTADHVYDIRNTIVHNYRLIASNPDAMDSLNFFTDLLETIVHQLVGSYHEKT